VLPDAKASEIVSDKDMKILSFDVAMSKKPTTKSPKSDKSTAAQTPKGYVASGNSPPDSSAIAKKLGTALQAAAAADKTSLEKAIAAGQVVVVAKQWLKEHTLELRGWAQWFAAQKWSFSVRTANDYEKIYEQVNLDSSASYQSQRECLRAYQKRVGKRKRDTFEQKPKTPKPPKPTEEQARAKAERAKLLGTVEPISAEFKGKSPVMLEDGIGEILAPDTATVVVRVTEMLKECSTAFAPDRGLIVAAIAELQRILVLADADATKPSTTRKAVKK